MDQFSAGEKELQGHVQAMVQRVIENIKTYNFPVYYDRNVTRRIKDKLLSVLTSALFRNPAEDTCSVISSTSSFANSTLLSANSSYNPVQLEYDALIKFVAQRVIADVLHSDEVAPTDSASCQGDPVSMTTTSTDTLTGSSALLNTSGGESHVTSSMPASRQIDISMTNDLDLDEEIISESDSESNLSSTTEMSQYAETLSEPERNVAFDVELQNLKAISNRTAGSWIIRKCCGGILVKEYKEAIIESLVFPRNGNVHWTQSKVKLAGSYLPMVSEVFHELQTNISAQKELAKYFSQASATNSYFKDFMICITEIHKRCPPSCGTSDL